MSTISINFQFALFEKENTDELDVDAPKNNFTLCDFGLNYSYFFVHSEHDKHLSALVNTLKGTIEGRYCLIALHYQEELPFFIGINMDWLSHQVDHDFELEKYIQKILVNWNNEFSLFTSRYLAYHQEYQHVSNRDLLTKSYFLQFLYHFVKDIQEENLAINSETFKKIDLLKVREITDKITHDFHKSIPSVNEMAEMAGMSASKFKNLFYELFGVSPHQYLLTKKMEYARSLLQTGKYSIRQVAYKVGYLYPSGFTRVYKQKFNQSPNNACFKK